MNINYYKSLWFQAHIGEPDECGEYECIEDELGTFATENEILEAYDESNGDIQKLMTAIFKKNNIDDVYDLYVHDNDGKVLLDTTD